MPVSFVFVWENNLGTHTKIRGHTWPGHASINIGTAFDEPRKNYETANDNGILETPIARNYVSWFPSQGANFGFLDIFAKKQLGHAMTSFVDDVASEAYFPDHVIALACTEDNINHMMAEWQTIRLKPSGASYKSFRKNCSTIVSRVLHAGGFYAFKWAVDNNFVWTPADILKLALEAGGELMEWAEFLDIVDEDNFQANPTFYPDLKDHNGRRIDCARDRAICTTGAKCRFFNGIKL